MKRIIAAFYKKLESVKTERNIKRLLRSIDIAKDNALDKIEDIEVKKANLVETLPEVTDYNSFVQKLSDYFEEQDNQNTVIKQLDRIKEYLEEDIKIEEDKK